MGLREKNISKRRLRILVAARKIIEAKGPDALSMRNLAKESRLAVTTLYNIFGSKDDILSALIVEGLSTVRPVVGAARKVDPFSAVIALSVEPVRRLIEHKSIFLPIISMGYRNVQTRADQVNQEIYASIISAVAQLIATTQASGHFLGSTPAELIAAEVFYTYRIALEDWGCAEIDDAVLARRIKVGVLLTLLSVSTPKSRPRLLRELRKAQAGALADLRKRFPLHLNNKLPFLLE